jgi:glycosyltransferase involved in cell wall biosynthesis
MQSRILSVGRLVPRKGHTYLIEAVKKLVAEGMDIKLVIVGFGPEKERLQKQAEGLDCEIRSGISEEEVNAEYKQADLFVLPSITDSQGEKEGLGLVSLEAMSYNVPVIAFNNGGVGEVVINDLTGILLPEKDINGLTAAIKKVLNDQSLRQKLTKQAVDYSQKTFATKVLVAQQSDIYKDILKQRAVA